MPTNHLPPPSAGSDEPSGHRDGESARVRRAEGYHAWVILFFAAKIGTLGLLVAGHFAWAIVVLFLPAPWYAWQVLRPAARGLGPAVTKFRTDQREVWLTIDDGPDPASTPAMLALLDQHRVRATFFLVGLRVERHPELVSEILRRGHTIGNHTHTHPQNTFWYAGARRTAAEIERCAAALRATGVETKLFRPPVGLKNHSLHPALNRLGLDLVLWSARGFDTICDEPRKTLARIVANIEPGAIVLVHETPTKVAQQNELVAALLEHLAREGYRCVIPNRDALLR